MGGSAASCVAALVAASALLDRPVPMDVLYRCALAGESAASGAEHGDNVGPMLLGGLALATHERLVSIPVPDGLTCVLVHPHQVLETRTARAVLERPFELPRFVEQSANLALVLAGCFRNDLDCIRAGLRDVLVEPLRAPLVRGFAPVKAAALEAGRARGEHLRRGPERLRLVHPRPWPSAIALAMEQAFRAAGIDCDAWISPVAAPAARLVA